MACFFVRRGGPMPARDRADGIRIEGMLNKRGGSTGQRGGQLNWRSRHCVLCQHVFYYSDSPQASQANGHLHLQGVGVRHADNESNRLLTLCMFWPEDHEATFYVQAPNAASRDEWLSALREAAKVTPESLAALGMAELKQRVVACGLVDAHDDTLDRRQLQELLVAHAAARPANYHDTPPAVVAHTTERTTGLAKSVLVTPAAKPSLLSAALGRLRGAVSLNKTRFQQDGFDLDLTYITPRLLAMAFPSVGLEGYYRNDLEQVQRFFRAYHPAHHYRVFNLCEERVYDGAVLGGEAYAACLHHFPFDDHNPPVLEMIHPFCVTLREWLESHPENVAAVHCKAGKGRTGLIVACALVHLGVVRSAEEALEYFGTRRTHDGEGVTIPSQKRYVGYYVERFGSEGAAAPTTPSLVAAASSGVAPPPGTATCGSADRPLGLHSSEGARAELLTRPSPRATPPPLPSLSLPPPPPAAAGSTAASAGFADENEAGLWPCKLLRSLGLRWQSLELPQLLVTQLTMHGCPHSKHRELGCHPYLIVRHSTLVPRELFGERQAAHPRIVNCTCTTQEHRRIFDSRRHVEPARVEHGATVTLVSGTETPPLAFRGDAKFTLYDAPLLGPKTALGHFWVHSAFLAARCAPDGSGGEVTFRRHEVDKACKKKYDERYPDDFALTLCFERCDDERLTTNHDLYVGVVEQDDETDDEGDAEEEEDLIDERPSRLSTSTPRPRRLSDSASAALSMAGSSARWLLGLKPQRASSVTTVL